MRAKRALSFRIAWLLPFCRVWEKKERPFSRILEGYAVLDFSIRENCKNHEKVCSDCFARASFFSQTRQNGSSHAVRDDRFVATMHMRFRSRCVLLRGAPILNHREMARRVSVGGAHPARARRRIRPIIATDNTLPRSRGSAREREIHARSWLTRTETNRTHRRALRGRTPPNRKSALVEPEPPLMCAPKRQREGAIVRSAPRRRGRTTVPPAVPRRAAATAARAPFLRNRRLPHVPTAAAAIRFERAEKAARRRARTRRAG